MVLQKIIKKLYTILSISLLFSIVFGPISFNGDWAWGFSKAEASGTQPLGDLEIGDRVVDRTWLWEFRSNRAYGFIGGDCSRPVTWIVVAKDHYDGMEAHVTLLSEELIGRYWFDNSKDRGHHEYGSNHWGNSGEPNATRGVRPWLNSGSFYGAISDHFKSYMLTTNLPNRKWDDGEEYFTGDKVFIPSASELGGDASYEIGSVFDHFSDQPDELRIARLNGFEFSYMTRSPYHLYSYSLWCVGLAGNVFTSP